MNYLEWELRAVSEPMHLIDVFLRDKGALPFIRFCEQFFEFELIDSLVEESLEIVSYLVSEEFAVLVSALIGSSGCDKNPNLLIVGPSSPCSAKDILLLLLRGNDITTNEVVVWVDAEVAAPLK
jgi:hypothetical protein